MLRTKMNVFRVLLPTIALAILASCSSGGGGAGGGGGVPTSPGGGPGNGGAPELNSPPFGAGATYQHRFMTAGTFGYYCSFHVPMTGTVVVSAAAADTLVNVSITSSSQPFPAASVKPGGRVIWTNQTGMMHTVTSL